jgi:hypothetical protein
MTNLIKNTRFRRRSKAFNPVQKRSRPEFKRFWRLATGKLCHTFDLMTKRLLLVLCGVCGFAANISVLGPPGDPPPGGVTFEARVWAASWTSAGEYQNVSIDAWVAGSNLFPSTSTTLEAYLMTQIGPGTTVAQEVASVTVPVLLTNSSWSQIALFSGLTLPAGSYYLVLREPLNAGYWGICNGTCTPITAGDVTLNPDQVAFVGPAYYPESAFQSVITSTLAYSVTGDAVGEVPEPSSLALTVLSLSVLFATARQAASSRAKL